MPSRWSHPALAVAVAVAGVSAAHAQLPDAPPRIQSGFLVQPDTVAVGDPFRFIVSVVVPEDARVEWAAIADTIAPVAMRSPVRVQTTIIGTTRRETATYDLAAWNVGQLPIGVPDATVRAGATVIKVPLAAARVFVQTVLPGDTSLHVPKPAKPLFQGVVPWWERWVLAALVLAALLLLWWIIRRRKPPVVRPAAAPVDVYVRAMHDFDRLERLALADAGERGRAVALAVEIMRVYLGSRMPRAALSFTSSELLEHTQDDPRVPAAELGALLADADAIKFARYPVQSAHAKQLAADARSIVEVVEAEHLAAIAAEEALRRAAEEAARDDRAAHEEDARRRSRRKAGVS
jgi:hypothetical protein